MIASSVPGTVCLVAMALIVSGCGAGAGDPLARADIHRTEDGRWISQRDGAELVRVPGATFTMGSDDGAFDERPAHRVRVGDLLIDRFEVTNARFDAFVRQTGYRSQGPWRRGAGAGADQHPVRFVTWFDATAYCDHVGRVLPTEAQWELAARGPDGNTWPWGEQWCSGCARTDAGVDDGPTDVGSFPQGAGPSGAEDLAGNAWEWVADWYDRHYYESFDPDEVAVEPAGPPDGAEPEPRFVQTNTAAGNERSTLKAIRGGGWSSQGAEYARGSRRMWGNPQTWLNDTGFRCALPLEGR